MRQQSYLVRKGARYHFRRRIRHQASGRPISISLETADPGKARCLARRLAVKWDELDMVLNVTCTRGTLTLEEQEDLFRRGLKDELARATAHVTAPIGLDSHHELQHKVMAAAYRVVARMPSDAMEIDRAVVAMVVPPDWSEKERRLLDNVLKVMVTPMTVSAAEAGAALAELGAPANAGTVAEARAQILRGYVEAHQRAELIYHPLIQARGGSPHWLLDDLLVMEVRQGSMAMVNAPSATPVANNETHAEGNLFFAKTTVIRFSEQIDDVVEKMFADNNWQPDGGRNKHMLEAFAWLTGDRIMPNYGPDDPKEFARRLARIPVGFKMGKAKSIWRDGSPFHSGGLPRGEGRESTLRPHH